MKKQIFTLALSVAVGAGLAAAAPLAQDQSAPDQSNGAPQTHQGWQGRRMNPDQQAQRLAKRLKLSDDQQNQVKSILADQMQQMQSIRQDTSLQPQDRRAKVQSLREDSSNKIRALLNDDQKKKYDDMQKRMHERMEQHRHGTGAPGGNANQ